MSLMEAFLWVFATESVAILSPLSSLTVYISILHYFCAKNGWISEKKKSFPERESETPTPQQAI